MSFSKDKIKTGPKVKHCRFLYVAGWVLVNYPTTFDQAVLFEEAISGLKIPGVLPKHKIVKSLADIVYMCEEATNELEELRHSNLVPDPAEKREPLAYDTVLTAFINVEQEGIFLYIFLY